MPAVVYSSMVLAAALSGAPAEPDPSPGPVTTAAANEPHVILAQQEATAAPSATAPSEVPPATSIVAHGFFSQGYIRSTDNNYIVKSKEGSFEFSEVGVNFAKALTDRLTVGLQLISQAIGAAGKFRTRADWYHLDYRYTDWLGFRAGRVKIPFGLYNELGDVDAARVPVLLPQSVYPLENRNLLLAQSGAEIYGYRPSKSYGNLDYQLYAGTIVLDEADIQTTPAFNLRDVTTRYIVGTRVFWETPLEGYRVGASLQSMRFDADLFFPAVTQAVTVTVPALVWAGSMEYVRGRFEVAAEYGRWHLKMQSTNARLFKRADLESERAYVMSAYHVADWFQVGSYYSRFVPDVHIRAGPDSVQHDVAGTLRFDINSYWLVKFEGHFMSGTASLTEELNENVARSRLADRWGLFLVKTTAYF